MDSRGSTLIEVVSVILIISILGGVVIAGVGLIENVKFHTKVIEIEQAFNYAREHAVKTGKSYNVVYAGDSIFIKQGMELPNYKIKFDGSTRVAEDSTAEDILFRGTMAPTRAGTLELINDKIGKRAKITVRIATGKVTKQIYNE